MGERYEHEWDTDGENVVCLECKLSDAVEGTECPARLRTALDTAEAEIARRTDIMDDQRIRLDDRQQRLDAAEARLSAARREAIEDVNKALAEWIANPRDMRPPRQVIADLLSAPGEGAKS